MDNKPQELSFADALKAAPAPIQTFLNSGAFAEAMARVQAEAALTEQAFDAVSREAIFTLIGLAEAEDLPELLASEAGIPSEKIELVMGLLAREVFSTLTTAPATPAPTPAAPKPPAPAPRPQPVPQPIAPSTPPAAAAPKPLTPPAAAQKPAVPTSYTTDPYREPI